MTEIDKLKSQLLQVVDAIITEAQKPRSVQAIPSPVPAGSSGASSAYSGTKAPIQVDLGASVTATFTGLISAQYKDKTLFSGYIEPLRWTRNLNCWATSVDTTGFAVAILGLGGVGGGTLITKKHVLLANHVPYPPSFKIYFVDKANQAYEYTVVKTQRVGNTDMAIGELNTTVSDNLRVYSVLPANIGKYLTSTSLPVLFSDQEKKALVGAWFGMENTDGGTYANVGQPTDPSQAALFERAAVGDSGNPVVTLVNGLPVLLGAWYRTWYTNSALCSYIPAYIAEINSALAPSGFKLKEADMSNFKQV